MHTAYLEAKRAIDDRSLNAAVWSAMEAAVLERAARPVSSAASGRGRAPAVEAGDAELRIAEVGAGTGTMVDRLRDWGIFAGIAGAGRDIRYDAWEINPETAARLATRLEQAPEIATWQVHTDDVRRQADAAGTHDVMIANAVLDLFDPAEVAELVHSRLAPGGVLYASIVFDGVSLMEPVVDPALDAAILDLYHQSMGGGFGRRQLRSLWESGCTIHAVGSSDWIIPPRHGGPEPDEAELVSTILSMMAGSVAELLEQGRRSVHAAVSSDQLEQWIVTRREQLARGELMFEAHQFDFLAER